MDNVSTGLVLKDIGNFNMKNFEGRLILQKTAYLLKSFGVDLGYQFGWYLHGTYSPTLTRAGLEVEKIFDSIPSDLPVRFADAEIQGNYDRFVNFIGDKKYDADMLEICSSICFFHKKGVGKEDILEMVERKKKRFTREQCTNMWDDLEKYGVV